MCVLINDIGRRLPLELQCSYQGQQGDVSQSVPGNYKTRFCGGQNLTTVEGNALVYHVYPESRTTGERRAEFIRAWGHGFEQKGAGRGGRTGGATRSVRGNYNSLKGIDLTVLEGVHRFIMYIR